ncbi:transporter substrate-binding domain-containing protein [Erwiniaceae bacterium L1_54_6]|nr:transporter substrate-binding domain-containing protein [Erwiniaceae bacterium L1_54_6]
MNKKTFLPGIFCAALMLALPMTSQAATAPLRIATEGAFPPFNQTTPNGKIVGFEPDMIAEIAKRAGFSYEIIAQKWSGIIPGLMDGKYDAVVDSITITPARAQAINFSRPYTNSISGFVTLKKGAIPVLPGADAVIPASNEAGMNQSLTQLKKAFAGKTIAVQVATIQADFLNKYLADVATIRTYQAGPETYADLSNGRVDAVMASVTNMAAFVDKHKDSATITGYRYSGGVLGVGSAIGLRKDEGELKTRIDAALNSMIKDGTLKALSMKWFGTDVTPSE